MATVFIWNNNISGAFARKQKFTLGHSSVNLNDQWGQVSVSNVNNYVSWWPESATSSNGAPEKSFLNDLILERYIPDHIIRIPDASLKIGNMRAEWIRIAAKPGAQYLGMRKNCSTIVARVLRAGSNGGGRHRHHAIWTPLKVKRFALALGGTAIKWSTLLSEMKNCGAIDGKSRNIMEGYMRRDSRSGKNSTCADARFTSKQKNPGYSRPTLDDVIHHPSSPTPPVPPQSDFISRI